MMFLIFFSLVLLIYGSANYYIYNRGYQALSGYSSLRPWYTGLFIFLAASYVIARILERYLLCVFTDVLTWVGAFWMAAMLYFFLFVLLTDIIRLIILIAFPILALWLPSKM